MPDTREKSHEDWRIPDALWERILPLLPPRKPHPLGCHRPRVDDRKALDAIFSVLRTGCRWHALHATGLCSGRAAHRRFQGKSGPRRASALRRGPTGWWNMRPCRELIGRGWRWTGR